LAIFFLPLPRMFFRATLIGAQGSGPLTVFFLTFPPLLRPPQYLLLSWVLVSRFLSCFSNLRCHFLSPSPFLSLPTGFISDGPALIVPPSKQLRQGPSGSPPLLLYIATPEALTVIFCPDKNCAVERSCLPSVLTLASFVSCPL